MELKLYLFVGSYHECVIARNYGQDLIASLGICTVQHISESGKSTSSEKIELCSIK